MHVSHVFSRRRIALIAAVALLAVGTAQAQTPATTDAAAPAAQATQTTPVAAAEQRLTIQAIYDRVEAAGYRDLREVEFKHDHYQVKAHNKQGERVKLRVNATSGAVEQQKVKPAKKTIASDEKRLNIREIYDRVEAAGYRDLHEIELEHGRYEVKGHNAQAQRVKLKVNAATGAVEEETTKVVKSAG